MTLLCKGLDDVRVLGIYGMGGIGKTTLSKAIYERVSHQFEASCFISSIREESRSTRGLVDLKIELISLILGERDINIRNDYRLSQVIANRLRTKKVIIVLDDVDRKDQLDALAGSRAWFGKGSRIIITSRDCHLLKGYVDDTYEVKVLNEAEALRVFSRKAFKKPHPEENYVQLSNDVVSYAHGLPLALEVFGSSLFGKTMDVWKSARDKFKENPDSEILDKLKISFDGLEDLEKELFLDIACFFNREDRDRIRHILESTLGYSPDFDSDVLVDKSLISISWGRLWMHDLLRKMGQKIVHDESKEPGARSRLWHDKDVIWVLKNDTGTNAVKGIVLELPLKRKERLNVEAFSKMTRLKILDITTNYPYYDRDYTRTLEWHGDFSNFKLSNELCVMGMPKYPFESLPNNFEPNNLVELIMPHSCIKKLWDERTSFSKLKRIDLSFSKNLVETPDLSEVPNLEELQLRYCTSLSKVHPSIGLRQLRELNLRDCKSLERLADEMRSESLKKLVLSGCSRLNKLPDFVGNMTSLCSLQLDGTAIKELPFSSKTLCSLNISNCSRLEKIPKDLISVMECPYEICVAGGSDLISILMPNSFSSLSSLKHLDFSNCNLSDGAIPNDLCCLSSLFILNLSGNKFTRIPNIWQLSELGILNLSHCNLLDGAIPNDLSGISSLAYLNLSGNNFTRLPNTLAQLSGLEELYLEDCSLLRVLPKLPLKLFTLRIKGCPLLKMFYDQLDVWTSNEILRSTDCSFAATYIDYDGKPSKILYLHPRSPVWIESNRNVEYINPLVACGPALLGSGISEWFNDKSTNSSGTIQMHTDWGSFWWMDYALFIVYEFHEPDRKS